MDRLLLTPVLAGVGALMVGPWLSHVVLRWMGWRVTLPLVGGWVAPYRQLGTARVQCRGCGSSLAPKDLPVLPWLWLRGRCPDCKEPIGRGALGVELTTGLLFGVVAAMVGWSVALVPLLALAAGIVATSAVDLTCSRIPTLFVYTTGIAVAAGLVLTAVVRDELDSLTGAALGAVVYLVILGALWLASPRLLGFGDVRLGVVLGMAVGWAGWSADHPVEGPLSLTVSALLFGSLLGSLVGIALLTIRKKNRPFPFAPWLSLGAMVAILAAV